MTLSGSRLISGPFSSTRTQVDCFESYVLVQNVSDSTDQLQRWIQSRPHPIILVFNTNQDRSWPENSENDDYEVLLEEENIHRVFAGNVRNLSNRTKVKPIPIGLKWQWRSTLLFGEDKEFLFQRYSQLSTSENGSKQLFYVPNRTDTVWMRQMMNSNKRTQNYERNTDALKTARADIPRILEQSAPLSLVTEKVDYFTGLKENRFVVSPAGNGLDTHATWEALLAGCIPIVPKSPLDPLFEDLPVWLIGSWSDVTDASVKKMAEVFRRGTEGVIIGPSYLRPGGEKRFTRICATCRCVMVGVKKRVSEHTLLPWIC